ncbi:dTDP-glucose 4,6-dehydratase [Candidatus Pelagibacter sp.]|uniref:dTDP-glucose 4,6-dehydratase n=1 Tax=Candidatus Pelagibacter sp. TaxID=2024849 RepID=UPI003F842CE7
MKKVVVTGGLGFIGSNLIDLLINKKYFVINIDKITHSSNFYNTRNFKNSKNYKFIKLDIRNKKLKAILFKYKPLGIFNLAAESHVDKSIDDPRIFIQSNIVGASNLLEAFKDYSKIYKSRLIHVSTDEIYGDILTGRSSEYDPYNPSSPYAASKAASNHLVSSFIRTYKIPAIVTNCSNNYGPRQDPTKLIPKLIYNILHNKQLPIYGKGVNSREWIYVKDNCEALIKVFLKGRIGQFYNIGSNQNLNNLQVSKMLIKYSKSVMKLGQKVKINFVKDRPGHDLRYALNINKIKKELKWYPDTSFQEGIKLTFDWYRKNKEYYKKFR